MPKTKISAEFIEHAMNQPAVRAGLDAKARRMLPRGQRLAAAAGATELAKALRLERGVRPGTKAVNGIRRPYTRLTADLTDEMKARDARARLTRRQILWRASRA
jgi:hypothetical protein